MTTVKDFYTLGSMLTLSGSTGATFVVCNGMQQAFNFNPRWFALLVAMLIVLGGVVATSGDTLGDYAVGVVNGFLVYCSAAGATGLAGSRGANSPAAPAQGVPEATGSYSPVFQRRFLSPWF